MTPPFIKQWIALLAMCLCTQTALPEGIRVSPTTLEVTAPGAATGLTIVNQGRENITIQARVFRWTQQNGREEYVPTQDVVVSPPMTQLPPGTQQLLRVVRVSGGVARGEESYRIYIDQIPDRANGQGGTVSFTSRLRIPVFFTDPSARAPQVEWSVLHNGNQAVLQARNVGDTRLRIADLQVLTGNRALVRQNGLFGYVLGGSVMQWSFGGGTQLAQGSLSLRAMTNAGSLNAPITRH